MKRLLALVIILAFSFISCSETKESNGSSDSAVSSGEVTQDALTQDESYKDILSKDDVLLMTTDINGSKRYICVNEKMNKDYDTSNMKFEKYDFAVLTDINIKQ